MHFFNFEENRQILSLTLAFPHSLTLNCATCRRTKQLAYELISIIPKIFEALLEEAIGNAWAGGNRPTTA